MTSIVIADSFEAEPTISNTIVNRETLNTKFKEYIRNRDTNT